MKLSTELIKEIYKSVDENLKAKIQIEVPEIKTSLDANRWITTDSYMNEKWLAYVNPDGSYYGFNSKGDWFPAAKADYNPLKDSDNRYAKPEEVETALINEAKKKGFTFGKYFKELQDKGNGGLIEKSGRCGKWFDFKDNKLFVIGYGRWKIFDNGTWATIITEPTQKEILQKQVDELKRQIDLL
jgi:hypothetical protein